MERIEIDYKPREWTLEHLHNAKERWILLICHRRAGKTTAAINHLIRDCVRKPGKYAYIAPTYKQAKMIAWDMLKQYTQLLPMKYNEAELTAIFPNGSKMYLLGSENPDSLKGIGLQGVVMDEYAKQVPEAWEEVIRHTLIDTKGYALFIGTPKGKNHLYDMYNKALKSDEWHTIILTNRETHAFPEEELESIRRDVSPEKFQQEQECSFLIKDTAYFENIEQVVVLPHLTQDRNLDKEYVMGVDLAKHTDFTAITVFERGMNRLVDAKRIQENWVTQRYMISDIARKYNANIIIDSTGVGDVAFDELEAMGLPVEGYKFTHVSKEQLMRKLRHYISQKFISLVDVKEIIEELKDFNYPSLEASVGKHDDYVCSIALAVHLLDQPTSISNIPAEAWTRSYRTQF